MRVYETHYFDVANLHNYDLILGTPFMYQHEVLIRLNESRVVIGSATSKPISGLNTSKLSSRAMELVDDDIEKVRTHLMEYAESAGLFADPSRSPLPPLRDINHSINLIDETLVIPWRPAWIAEALRSQWVEKKDLYLKSGRWQISNSRNTVPLLCIPKPNKLKDKPELRTCFDLRAQNKNTIKVTAPLPQIEGVMWRAASRQYCSLMDQRDAYEQIRIIPEHVSRTAVTTPDGNIESLVMQQGDCNVPGTWQALMNHIFSSYIGVFMDVYLDDIC
jgi:hypothetical protein